MTPAPSQVRPLGAFYEEIGNACGIWRRTGQNWNSKSGLRFVRAAADMTPRQKSVDKSIHNVPVSQGCRFGFLTFELVDLAHSIASPIQSGVTSTARRTPASWLPHPLSTSARTREHGSYPFEPLQLYLYMAHERTSTVVSLPIAFLYLRRILNLNFVRGKFHSVSSLLCRSFAGFF